MIKNSILTNTGAILLVLCCIFSCNTREPESLDSGGIITVTASFEKDDTRVTLEESSLSLVSRWSPGDQFDIYANGELLARNVPAGNFSEDWKKCSFGVPIPEGRYNGEIELVCVSTDGNPTLIDGKLFCNASLKRMPLANYRPPVIGHATVTDRNHVSVKFKHYLTYEVVHILNRSGKEISFSLNGYSAKETWLRSKGAVAEDGSFRVDTPATEDPVMKSSTIRIPDSGTDVIISAYLPNGGLIHEAKMVAEIDGQDVISVNSKSSDIELQTCHAYHMYVVWDGEVLKFADEGFVLGELVVDPIVEFDDVVVGSREYRYLTIYNNGTGEQRVQVAIEGSSPGGPFFLPNADWDTDIAEKVIPAGGHRSVEICLKASSPGDYNANAVVTSAGLPGGKCIVPLHGRGVEEDTSFHLSANEIEVYLHDNEIVEIHNGSGEYNVVNENPDVVEWDINGIHVAHAPATRSPGDSGGPISYDCWYITGKELGDATLRLTDKQTGEVLTLKVKVIRAPSLLLAQDSVELPAGDREKVEILSGSGWYEVTVDDPAVATAYKSTISNEGIPGPYDDDMPQTGVYVTIDALAIGHTTVRVKDKSSDEEATIQVSVRSKIMTPEIIDLGLSVQWASFNLGATKPEEYGYYYAWGETEPKDAYWYSNYKFKNVPYPFHILSDEDDAARMNLGEGWRIPTKAEWLELLINCKIRRLEDNSWQFTAPNGNSIILPAANCIYGTDFPSNIASSSSFYWSSTVSKDGRAYAHVSNYSGYHSVGLLDKSYGGPSSGDGFPVRAVYGGPPQVTSIAVFCEDHTEYSFLGRAPSIEYPLIIAESTITKSFTVYNEGDVDLAVSVTDPTSYGWWNPDSGQALTYYSVREEDKSFTLSPYEEKEVPVQYLPLSEDDNASGHIYLYSNAQEGPANVYFESNGGIRIRQGSVAEPVDLGLSVKWASWNLGASKQTEGGNFYAWGETEPKLYFTWETYKYYNTAINAVTKYNASDLRTVLEPADDAAHINWGNGWRIPTDEEYNELIANCTVEWVEEDGVNGCRFTGQNGNSIFLPMPGYCYENNIIEDYNEMGTYWFANIDKDRDTIGSADYLYYEPNTGVFGIWGSFNFRFRGKSIRPVYDASSF